MAYPITKWQTESEREYILSETNRLFDAEYDTEGKVIIPPHHKNEE